MPVLPVPRMQIQVNAAQLFAVQVNIIGEHLLVPARHVHRSVLQPKQLGSEVQNSIQHPVKVEVRPHLLGVHSVVIALQLAQEIPKIGGFQVLSLRMGGAQFGKQRLILALRGSERGLINLSEELINPGTGTHHAGLTLVICPTVIAQRSGQGLAQIQQLSEHRVVLRPSQICGNL